PKGWASRLDERRLTRAEREAAERRAWDDFKAKLHVATTLGEALEIALSGPGPDRPGRKFHTSLLFFLNEFRKPGEASAAELSLYRALAEKLMTQPLDGKTHAKLAAFLDGG